ncbi:hypothetical protein BDW62DRAFT_212068 [Aspergillus aurantiobrunneus]
MSSDNFAAFCHGCNLWFNSQNEWYQHCQIHLSKPDRLLCCDTIIFWDYPVKPGYCPFFLGSTDLGPLQQIEQYLDLCSWYNHVQAYLSYQNLSGKFYCRHPSCTEVYQSLTELVCHLEDLHCFKPPRGKKRPLSMIEAEF